jgi:hypothetical protein
MSVVIALALILLAMNLIFFRGSDSKNPTGAFLSTVLLRGQVDTSNEPAGFNF